MEEENGINCYPDDGYDYLEEIDQFAYHRNRIKRLEEAAFQTQCRVWRFFSIAWLTLLHELRRTQAVTISNEATWRDELKKIRSSMRYQPLSNSELAAAVVTIQKRQKLSSKIGALRSKLFNKENEKFSFPSGRTERYNMAFLPHHKTIKALTLAWVHETSFRINIDTPVWNFVSFYYTCMAGVASLVRALDPNLGQFNGHKDIWRQYSAKVLGDVAVRESIASPFNERAILDPNDPTGHMVQPPTPFFEIIREYDRGLFFSVSEHHSKSRFIHFFHFAHRISEYFRYKNILPVLFTRSPAFSQNTIQLNGLCDYLLIFIETLLIRLLSAEVIEFFMHNFIVRNKSSDQLARRYEIYRSIGIFPEERKGKIPYGGHEILDQLIENCEI